MVKGIYLTLLVGPVVPVPVPSVVIDALTGVSVTNDTSGASGFELTFTLSNRSPLHTIFLVTSGQTPLLRVVLVATVNGTPQVLMDGVTTKMQVGSGSRPGESTLSVMGEDLTKVMDLVDLTGLPFPAMPAEARVAAAIAKYAAFGIVPMVIPCLFTDIQIPIEKVAAQKGTDLYYLRELAEAVGYTFYIEPGPAPGTSIAYWGPEIKVGNPQPALNLDMDAYTNVETMNFSFNTADTTLPVVLIQNQQSKLTIPVPIPKLNPLQPPLAAIPAPITNVTVLHETAKMSPTAALSYGLGVSARSADAVSAQGTLDVTRYGRLLRSRQLVGVRGAGTAYDGLYFVKSVRTSIKRGEMKQDFTLTRNGLVSLTPGVPV